MKKAPIYLDYNATTPIDPAVAAAMRPFLDSVFGNPSSSHSFGLEAKKAVESARHQVAALLSCRPDEVVFTSGGSESNNYAIKGAAFAYREKGNHIITSAVEHPAVLEVCRFLEKNGFRVTVLPVDKNGMVSVADVEAAITPQTILITIMTANNEVGTIQPITEIAALARKRGILTHTDAAQAVGKIPVRVGDLGVDLLSVAGHKFYGPKGIGALYIRSGVKLEKLVHGADHERGWRAGTENILEIAGLGKACELALNRLERDTAHSAALRDRLEHALKREIPDCRVNGHPEKRLPNTLSISFRGVEANTLLSELTGVAASAGAACHTDRVDVSSVLEAMKVPVEYAMGTVRFSTGRMTSEGEIDRAAKEIVAAVRRLQPDGASVAANPVAGETVKLTRFTRGMGCACKIQPQLLEEILKKLPVPDDPNVLVGADTTDDAAVYKISKDTALVATVDFFTPVVDDAFQFGAIAAANALSDIYAMGAKPLFALNIVGFPVDRLPVDVLDRILAGARSKTKEAGIFVLGGHSVDDTEPKFGMAVVGTVHPDRILANTGARPGDALILTKAVGTGILATALKQGAIDAAAFAPAVETMAELNQKAAETMAKFTVHACTDVTGFGLVGHLAEMLGDGTVDVEIQAESIPVLPGARELAMADVIPGGTRNNLAHTEKLTDWNKSIPMAERLLLCDAQTSGGLLIAVSESDATALVNALQTAGVRAAAQIARFTSGTGRIRVVHN
ncbi:MAG: selenide, water dikinase SelD [Acidobacteria bacterium]|nr:selenide, water dikinase SelD [Acidobacteriota bacterium]